MKRSMILSMVLMAGLSACAPDTASEDSFDDDSSTAAATNYPTITFASDGTVTQSAALVAGSSVRVRYYQTRLRTCRDSSGGRVLWNITGFASADGAAATTFETTHLSTDGSRRTNATALVTLPATGHDLALWFQNTDATGCVAYDSRDGQNFHFAITGAPDNTPPVPTITFSANGNVAQSAPLVAGGSVKVHYEQDRLFGCRGTQGGIPQWSISGFASLNGGTAHSFETGVAAADGSRTTIDATVALSSAGDLALWFQNTNRWGCVDWDSHNGQNYHFTVSAH